VCFVARASNERDTHRIITAAALEAEGMSGSKNGLNYAA
jgi:hypothetical protein